MIVQGKYLPYSAFSEFCTLHNNNVTKHEKTVLRYPKCTCSYFLSHIPYGTGPKPLQLGRLKELLITQKLSQFHEKLYSPVASIKKFEENIHSLGNNCENSDCFVPQIFRTTYILYLLQHLNL